MVAFTVSRNAYAKVAFHAAKYPHRQVNGVLLGKEESGTVQVEDAVPLLHHWTGLSPSMEIGLDLARNYALSIGLELVGYYQASEYLNDVALAPVGEKVVETIRKTFVNAVAFAVDGSKLAAGEPALVPYLPQGSSTSWRPVIRGDTIAFIGSSDYRLEDAMVPTHVHRLIREEQMQDKLGDFDDHLEDVSIDWLRNADCNIGGKA